MTGLLAIAPTPGVFVVSLSSWKIRRREQRRTKTGSGVRVKLFDETVTTEGGYKHTGAGISEGVPLRIL